MGAAILSAADARTPGPRRAPRGTPRVFCGRGRRRPAEHLALPPGLDFRSVRLLAGRDRRERRRPAVARESERGTHGRVRLLLRLPDGVPRDLDERGPADLAGRDRRRAGASLALRAGLSGVRPDLPSGHARRPAHRRGHAGRPARDRVQLDRGGVRGLPRALQRRAPVRPDRPLAGGRDVDPLDPAADRSGPCAARAPAARDHPRRQRRGSRGQARRRQLQERPRLQSPRRDRLRHRLLELPLHPARRRPVRARRGRASRCSPARPPPKASRSSAPTRPRSPAAMRRSTPTFPRSAASRRPGSPSPGSTTRAASRPPAPPGST